MEQSYVDLNDLMAQTDCHKCGVTYQFHKRYMHNMDGKRSAWWLCKSCKATPVKVIRYGDDWCRPWKGDFDDAALVCLDSKGRPFMVGERTCGHADCVRREHLVTV